ncbi:hypothetical protein ACH4Y0_27475 [Streptomyces sp. NPDC020707]|uniref:hypothetical protein n=1 Tax=Streptomyces sp. NPDC020707 TaxID=3365084 RepID=UPI00379EEE24
MAVADWALGGRNVFLTAHLGPDALAPYHPGQGPTRTLGQGLNMYSTTSHPVFRRFVDAVAVGAALYVDSDDVKKQVTVGSWTADRPLRTSLATWALDSPTAGWNATRSLPPLSAKTTYAFYGWTKDSSWSARSVSFTMVDRDQLTPGMVRYDSSSENGDETAVTVATTEFEAKACQDT